MLTYREADEYTAPRRGGGPACQPGQHPGQFRRPLLLPQQQAIGGEGNRDRVQPLQSAERGD